MQTFQSCLAQSPCNIHTVGHTFFLDLQRNKINFILLWTFLKFLSSFIFLTLASQTLVFLCCKSLFGHLSLNRHTCWSLSHTHFHLKHSLNPPGVHFSLPYFFQTSPVFLSTYCPERPQSIRRFVHLKTSVAVSPIWTPLLAFRFIFPVARSPRFKTLAYLIST